MKMQRQHFEAIAETVRFLGVSEGDKRITARTFADMCERSNPLFDRARFLDACGIDRAAMCPPGGMETAQGETLEKFRRRVHPSRMDRS